MEDISLLEKINLLLVQQGIIILYFFKKLIIESLLVKLKKKFKQKFYISIKNCVLSIFSKFII